MEYIAEQIKKEKKNSQVIVCNTIVKYLIYCITLSGLLSTMENIV